MISWTRTVRLQRFLAHVLLKVYAIARYFFSFPSHLLSAATLPWDLNIMNLALNCWFSQCYNTRMLTAKLSPYYLTYLLFNLRFRREHEQDLLQTVRLFISEWDERCNWLQTKAEHDIVWNIWAGDHGELSCAHLNGEWQFHAKSHELIGAFLACSPDWAQGPPLLRAERGLPLSGSRIIVPVLRILCSRLLLLLSFQPLSNNSLNSIRAPYCFDRKRFLIRMASFCETFMILCNIYWYLGLDSFPR